MKKYGVILMTCIFALLPMCFVHAMDFSDIQIHINQDQEELIVQGSIANRKSGVSIVAEVISPCHFEENASQEEIDEIYQKKIEDISDKAEGYLQALHFVGQTTSTEQGQFTLPLKIHGESGLYLVRVKSADSDNIYSKYVDFYTKTYIDQIITQINSSTSTEQIKEILDREVYKQGLNTALYTAVTDSGTDMEAFYSKILSADDFKSFAEFKEYYLYHLAGFALESEDESLFETAVSKYADELKLAYYSGIYHTYTAEFDAETKKKVMTRLNTEKGSDYSERFAKAAFMVGFEKLNLWTQVPQYLTANSTNLIDLSDYRGDTSTLDKILITGTYNGQKFTNSFEDFETALKKIIRDNQNSGNSHVGGGSGSGGGAGKYSEFGIISGPEENVASDLTNPANEPAYFSDLQSAAWAAEAINALAKEGIVSGVGNGRFEPDTLVTREEFIVMIVNLLGLKPSGMVTMDFMDVKSDAWYYRSMLAAYSCGIIIGKGDGSVGIGEEITRQDMAVMAYRAMGMTETDAAEFADSAEIADYAKEAVGALSAKGILNGFEDRTFRPKNFATRAEAAKIIYELYRLDN